jgi:hypothetical protein
MMDDAPTIAASLMSKFAQRTGLHLAASDQQRYLWTDAFAVCNFLELFKQTGDQEYQHCATRLIRQVHWVLGRYRSDDRRSGWISGYDEETGGRHPTAGGLRIGKPLQERGAGEPFDERCEWDRDGQYFHYLTKWIHALCQTAFVTGDSEYAGWAVELGTAAFEGFVHRSGDDVEGLYWKMSTDLSRPLVDTMGLFDALDGFITFREAQHTAAKMKISGGMTDLGPAIASLSSLCRHKQWITYDPLGLGGLFFDADRLSQLTSQDRLGDADLLEDLMNACRGGLSFLGTGYLNRPTSQRLPFRELGLAIGLRALGNIADRAKDTPEFQSRPALRRTFDLLLPYQSLSDSIIDAWLPHAQRQDEIWKAHYDINEVMLATALIPDMFLSIGGRVSKSTATINT